MLQTASERFRAGLSVAESRVPARGTRFRRWPSGKSPRGPWLETLSRLKAHAERTLPADGIGRTGMGQRSTREDRSPVQLTTDGHRAYFETKEGAFESADVAPTLRGP